MKAIYRDRETGITGQNVQQDLPHRDRGAEHGHGTNDRIVARFDAVQDVQHQAESDTKEGKSLQQTERAGQLAHPQLHDQRRHLNNGDSQQAKAIHHPKVESHRQPLKVELKHHRQVVDKVARMKTERDCQRHVHWALLAREHDEERYGVENKN